LIFTVDNDPGGQTGGRQQERYEDKGGKDPKNPRSLSENWIHRRLLENAQMQGIRNPEE